MATIFDKIRNEVGDRDLSLTWYKRKVSELASRISAGRLMREGKILKTPGFNQLNFFRYNPKTKAILPYYDTFPLVMPIDGAKGVIFNVSGGQDITLDEVTSASEVIKSRVHPDANIIFGSVTNPRLNGKIKITVIATGFPVLVDDDFIDRNIKQEGVSIDDLEVPPFLRKHPGALRRLRSGTL